MKQIALTLLACLATVACGKIMLSPPKSEIKNPIFKFAQRQPSDISVVTYAVLPNGEKDTTKHSIHWNVNQPMPLASSVKIFILAAYAKAVTAGSLDPESKVTLAEWEAFYIPGLDGGAHPNSLAQLKIPANKEGFAKDQTQTVSLDTLARFMIETSDNAATDLLITKLGVKALKQTIQDLKLTGQEEFGPFLGLVGNWATPDSLNTYAKLPTQERIALDWKKAEELSQDQEKRKKISYLPTWPNPKTQAQLALLTNAKGTTQDYSHLMSKILSGKMKQKELEIMQKYLGWPLNVNPQNNKVFTYLYAKGGSLPGVLTNNFAFQHKIGSRKGEHLVISIFIKNIPEQEYQNISAAIEDTMLRIAISPETAQQFLDLIK